jgi:HEAT repeat protein
MDKETEKAIKRVKNRFPLIGHIIRARGARALINTSEKEAVLPLIQALKDKSLKV